MIKKSQAGIKKEKKRAKFVGSNWQSFVKHAQFCDNSYFLFIGGWGEKKNRETASEKLASERIAFGRRTCHISESDKDGE